MTNPSDDYREVKFSAYQKPKSRIVHVKEICLDSTNLHIIENRRSVIHDGSFAMFYIMSTGTLDHILEK